MGRTLDEPRHVPPNPTSQDNHWSPFSQPNYHLNHRLPSRQLQLPKLSSCPHKPNLNKEHHPSSSPPNLPHPIPNRQLTHTLIENVPARVVPPERKVVGGRELEALVMVSMMTRRENQETEGVIQRSQPCQEILAFRIKVVVGMMEVIIRESLSLFQCFARILFVVLNNHNV